MEQMDRGVRAAVIYQPFAGMAGKGLLAQIPLYYCLSSHLKIRYVAPVLQR